MLGRAGIVLPLSPNENGLKTIFRCGKHTAISTAKVLLESKFNAICETQMPLAKAMMLDSMPMHSRMHSEITSE